MYIQDKVEEYADEVFERLDGGAHIYFCGLKVRWPWFVGKDGGYRSITVTRVFESLESLMGKKSTTFRAGFARRRDGTLRRL